MSQQVRYALLESAAGYALFDRKEGDDVASKLTEMQQLVLDFTRFARSALLCSSLRAHEPERTQRKWA